MKKHRLKQLFGEDEIRKRVKALAKKISSDYENGDVVLIGILKGSFVFLADLVRNLSIPVKIDFCRLASYGDRTYSTGEVRVTKEIEIDVESKDVLIVDDIVDSGHTLGVYSALIQKKKPRSVRICAFIDKIGRREKKVNVDYFCFRIKEGFVVGYGLDYNEEYRHLPGVFIIEFLEGVEDHKAGDR